MGKVLLKNVSPEGNLKLYIKNGMDIAINEARLVERIDYHISGDGFETIIDLKGMSISTGWIDLHTHIYYGVSKLGIDADLIGPATGVSVLVDAGTAGEGTFIGLREYILKKKDFQIYSFLNISSVGLTLIGNKLGEFDSLDKLNLDAMMQCIEDNRDYIKGLKVRASASIFRGWGIEPLKLAKKASTEAGIPLVVHISDPLPMIDDILPVLTEGDILTHCYHGKRWGILEKDGKPSKEAQDAYHRGVRFDVGHGFSSFSYDVAEKSIQQGLKPFSISSDLHNSCIHGPVWDMAATMSKMLEVGLTLEEIIDCVTVKPAEVLGIETYNEHLLHQEARFTVFTPVDCEAKLPDSKGIRTLHKYIDPKFTILGNRVIKASSNFKEINAHGHI